MVWRSPRPPDPPAAPVDPDRFPLDVAAAAVLVTVLGTIALTWAALRFLLARAHPEVADPSTPGAAVVVGLVLSVATLCLWVVDPFAALLLAPTLHLWILAALVDPPPPQRARIALVAGGLLLPALLALYVLVTLALDPIGAAWYQFLLVTGGHVSLTTLVGCVLAGVLGATIAIVRRRPEPGRRPARRAAVRRGAGHYAGPGSLGGTDSALRR